MRNLLSAFGVAACLSFGGAALFAEEEPVSLFVYPSEEYSPGCIKFFKDNNVKQAWIWAPSVKKGLAECYKDAGIKVICGQIPYKKLMDQPPAKIDETVKAWVSENIGEDRFKDIYAFEMDEPFLGYGDWKNEVLPDAEKDAAFKEAFAAKYGKQPAPKRGPGVSSADWRNQLDFRQRFFLERLNGIAEAFKKISSKRMYVGLTPAIYESGPTTGMDVNAVNAYLPKDIGLWTDPYFQAFRRPLQWSGMTIRHLRGSMDGRELGGVVQYYDAIKDAGWPHEGYTYLEPDDVGRQVFEYLMNGATDISYFVMGKRISVNAYDRQLAESLRFVRASEGFWKGTKPLSQVGIYFSENTYRMHDMWGPWSRMTGVYGASFQTEWTYYSLSSLHIPADMVSVEFNNEKGLLEKLKPYKVVVLPDVKCMSAYEAKAFADYVAQGGNVIATGETSFLDENGEPLGKPALAEMMGIDSFKKSEQHLLTVLPNGLLPGTDGLAVSFDGNAAPLFKTQASRHPQWLKDRCVKTKFEGYDLKFAEKIPSVSSLSVTPLRKDSVVAVHPDKSAAMTVNNFGKGRCVYIAPSDLTLFKGAVEDSLTRPGDSDLRALEFFGSLVSACVGQKTFEYEGPDGVEATARTGVKPGVSFIYLLNHNDKTAEGITLTVSGDFASGVEAVIFRQATCREEKLVCERVSDSSIKLKIPNLDLGSVVRVKSGTR